MVIVVLIVVVPTDEVELLDVVVLVELSVNDENNLISNF